LLVRGANDETAGLHSIKKANVSATRGSLLSIIFTEQIRIYETKTKYYERQDYEKLATWDNY